MAADVAHRRTAMGASTQGVHAVSASNDMPNGHVRGAMLRVGGA
jgi:hypothetical protein